MKSKINLINQSKDELTKKQKRQIKGGYIHTADCLCNTDVAGQFTANHNEAP